MAFPVWAVAFAGRIVLNRSAVVATASVFAALSVTVPGGAGDPVVAWGSEDAQTEATPVPGGYPLTQQQSDASFTLTILHNNDGESKLLPALDLGYPGVATFVERLKSLQAEAGEAVITLTSGDNFRASLELAVSLARSGPLYDSVALSGLYDAMALGNHDFDLGPEVTARFIEGFEPAVPFLSANLDASSEPALAALLGTGRLAPSTVVEAAGERIGVIGAVTPALPSISSPRRATVSEVLPAVRTEVAKLTAEGVDKIILVSHLQDVDEEIALVSGLADVDVVIAGGGDELLRNEGDTCMPDEEPTGVYPLRATDATGWQVPVATVPGGYRCIGELTVEFSMAGEVVASSGRSVGVAFDSEGDAGVNSLVTAPLSESTAALDGSVVGVSRVELNGRKQRVRTMSTNQGNLMADAIRAAATRRASEYGTPPPDAAILNGGGIRNDSVIPPGDITVGATWAMAPFYNLVTVGAVQRDAFKALLEQTLSRLPDANGQFPQISGFKLVYDPLGTARETDSDDCSLTGHGGGRVTHAMLADGTEIVRDGEVIPGDPVVLATVDFLADGGDCYPLTDTTMTRIGVSYRQALVDYISVDLDGVVTDGDYPEDDGWRIVAEDPSEKISHTVEAGDTLWGIARRYLGDGSLWPNIFELNSGVMQNRYGRLTNPDLIFPGWVLSIP